MYDNNLLKTYKTKYECFVCMAKLTPFTIIKVESLFMKLIHHSFASLPNHFTCCTYDRLKKITFNLHFQSRTGLLVHFHSTNRKHKIIDFPVYSQCNYGYPHTRITHARSAAGTDIDCFFFFSFLLGTTVRSCDEKDET